MEMKLAKLEIEAKSPYNDGWTRQHYQRELNTTMAKICKLKETEAKGVEMKKTDRRIELESLFPEVMFADGLDEAIIGWEASSNVVVYDYHKCMKIFMDRDGMDKHEAHEFMEFNVVSAYVGDFTPSFVHIYE